jgi:hypothetical protein
MQHPVRLVGTFSLAIFWLLAVAEASDKKLPIEQNSNELVEISATVTLDKDQIKQELGSDFGGDIVLVKVTVHPVSDKPIKVSLDDFLLVSGKDGQRAQPYTPSQLAGSDTLVVTRQEAPKQKSGFGIGLGGIMSGSSPGGADNSTKTETKAEKGDPDKLDPLLATLKDKVLQEKEITESISGFLYFQVVGKVKPKDLELHYKGPGGRLALRFRP